MELDPGLAGYDEARGRQIYAAVLDRLRAVPGVESASVAATVPFGMISLGRSVQRSGSAPGDKLQCSFNIVSANYFHTLGIPVLRGRSFERTDAANSDVAVVDQLTASRLWPNGEAVGQHIKIIEDEATHQTSDAEIVGVVGTVREHTFGEDLSPHLYVPFPREYQSDMNIHLRLAAVGSDAQIRMLETVRKEVHEVDGRLPVHSIKTLSEQLDTSLDFWIFRTGARMFAGFGTVALLVAMVGLYGVRAYAVARRTREIGIRMALGASKRETLRMILGEGLAITSIGVGIGLVLSVLLGKLLASFLFKVGGYDPLVLLAAPLCLGIVALLACYFPARKASMVDPMVALRDE